MSAIKVIGEWQDQQKKQKINITWKQTKRTVKKEINKNKTNLISNYKIPVRRIWLYRDMYNKKWLFPYR